MRGAEVAQPEAEQSLGCAMRSIPAVAVRLFIGLCPFIARHAGIAGPFAGTGRCSRRAVGIWIEVETAAIQPGPLRGLLMVVEGR